MGFTKAETRLLPGAFGDPFRAIEALPGVTPLASGLPYFYVRGAPPGNVGYYLDGIRVPLLFHLGLGPAVIHPGLIGNVNLFPDGSTELGRFTGGIVSADPAAPRAEPHAEGEIRVIDAGAIVEVPFDHGKGDVVAAGRYSYTGPLFSLIESNLSLAYGDYAARFTYAPTPNHRFTLFAFGSYDHLGQKQNPTDTTTTTLVDTMFHRIDLRYDQTTDDGVSFRHDVVLGWDQDPNIGADRHATDKMLDLKSAVVARLGPDVTMRAGVDLTLDDVDVALIEYPPPPPAPECAPYPDCFSAFFHSRSDLAGGAYGAWTIHIGDRFTIEPGVRADVYKSGTITDVGLDPRVSTSLRVLDNLTLESFGGLTSQPPSFIVSGPGFRPPLDTLGLQRALTGSIGLEWKPEPTWTLKAAVYATAFFNLNDALGTSTIASSSGFTGGLDQFDQRFQGRDTIIIAALLVIVVVMVFLQDWRAMLLPMIDIVVSLIGTFAVMALLGFSLNNLSLFGLVLAVGIVVDDSIVVVENVERWMGTGLAAREATLKAMGEITGPVIGVTLVLSSVFIPTAFMPGLTGQFFRQFALTIACAAIISATNAMTLSPARAVAWIKPHRHGEIREALPAVAYCLLFGGLTGRLLVPYLVPHLRGLISAGAYSEQVELGMGWAVCLIPGAIPGWFLAKPINRILGLFFGVFNKVFDVFTNGYGRLVSLALRLSLIVLVLYVGLLALTGFAFTTSPTGFIPDQDQGYLLVNVTLPDSASVQRTAEVSKQLEEIALKTPGVKQTMSISGFSAFFQCDSSNWGTIFVILDDFDKRTTPETQAAAIIRKLNAEYHEKVLSCQAAVFGAPPVPGLGQSGGFQLQIVDRTGMGLQALQEATDTIVQKANAQPGLYHVFTTFSANTPQLYIDIDREKAKDLGVPLGDVFNTLNSNMGSVYINQFNEFGRIWQVNIQAEGSFRTNVDNLGLLQVRNRQGDSIPLSTLIRVRNDSGPVFVMRYNDMNSSAVNGGTKPSFSSGQAIAVMQQLCDENLPAGMGYEWTNISYQETHTGGSGIAIFGLGVLLIFLVLAALYESWKVPFSIILVVPMCLLSSITGLVWIANKPIDIFSQIGFVVLVAMAAKNAILIVAYARDKRREGLGRREATVEACKQRLRPILMTSFAFIMGVYPLVVASGAGWEMQRSLGTAVFSGMIGVTFFGIFLTPVFYYVITAFGKEEKSAGAPAPGPSLDGEHKIPPAPSNPLLKPDLAVP